MLAITLLLAVPALPTGTETITLPLMQDATLYEDPLGQLANGAGQHMFVGRNSQGLERRALIRVSTFEEIPFNATLVSAKLRLHMSQTVSGPQTVFVHAVPVSWTEGPADPGGAEGQGAQAVFSDCTWTQRVYGLHDWAVVTSRNECFRRGHRSTWLLRVRRDRRGWRGGRARRRHVA